MQWPRRGEARLLGVGIDEFGDAIDERMRDAVGDRLGAPGQILGLLLLRRAALVALGQFQQPLGSHLRGG